MFIDNNEINLIKILPEDTFIKKQLHIGDIHFVLNDITVLIIERKTLSDLYSSIQDNRYREQKSRLFSFINENDEKPIIAYIIEGRTISKYINKSIIDSALLGTSIRDNIKLIYSDDINHTAELLLKIKKKLPEYIDNIKGNTYTSYTSNIKVIKKDNNTPLNCYIMQLAQINGVSTTIAEHIAKTYESMCILANAIKNNKFSVIKTIENIELENRKIGPVLANKIVNYINYTGEVKKISLKKIQ